MKKNKKTKGIVDRLEDGIAVILMGEDEEVAIEFPVCYLPDDVKEGDIVTLCASVKSRKTKEAKQKVAGMLRKLAK
ncbi:MAG: DUF3006 domain-containing protein [Candidatus Saganbacteria bacterium]|nr:DUF3006 domain-containing protein [Candidatus Saganbacteria bacterium]